MFACRSAGTGLFSGGWCASKRKCTARAGYTFIELLVLLALLAVLATLSLPLYHGSLVDRSLQNAAYLIQADFRLTQQIATASAGMGPWAEMCFRNDGYAIYLVDYQDPVARDPASVRMGRTVKVARAGQEYASSLAISIAPTAADPCLIDTGRPAVVVSSAGIPLKAANPDSAPKEITVSQDGRAFRITISPLTGRVMVSR